jgi:hypothetical protein
VERDGQMGIQYRGQLPLAWTQGELEREDKSDTSSIQKNIRRTSDGLAGVVDNALVIVVGAM